MKIETKYNIGDRVWIVICEDYETKVWSDYISGFYVEGDGEAVMYFRDSDFFEARESDLVPFENLDELGRKIAELDAKCCEELEAKKSNKA